MFIVYILADTILPSKPEAAAASNDRMHGHTDCHKPTHCMLGSLNFGIVLGDFQTAYLRGTYDWSGKYRSFFFSKCEMNTTCRLPDNCDNWHATIHCIGPKAYFFMHHPAH